MLGPFRAMMPAVAQAVAVTAEYLAVLGAALAGEYSVDISLDGEGRARSGEDANSPLVRRAKKAATLVVRRVVVAARQLASGGEELRGRRCVVASLTR